VVQSVQEMAVGASLFAMARSPAPAQQPQMQEPVAPSAAELYYQQALQAHECQKRDATFSSIVEIEHRIVLLCLRGYAGAGAAAAASGGDASPSTVAGGAGRCVVADRVSQLVMSTAMPDIPLHTYVNRFTRYLQVSPQALVMVHIYMSRIFKIAPQLQGNLLFVHRLFLGCLLIASKYCDDDVRFGMSQWAAGGGVPVHELMEIELKILFLIKWDTWISVQEFDATAQQAGIQQLWLGTNLHSGEQGMAYQRLQQQQHGSSSQQQLDMQVVTQQQQQHQFQQVKNYNAAMAARRHA
jgi:hypothetical protein